MIYIKLFENFMDEYTKVNHEYDRKKIEFDKEKNNALSVVRDKYLFILDDLLQSVKDKYKEIERGYDSNTSYTSFIYKFDVPISDIKDFEKEIELFEGRLKKMLPEFYTLYDNEFLTSSKTIIGAKGHESLGSLFRFCNEYSGMSSSPGPITITIKIIPNS